MKQDLSNPNPPCPVHLYHRLKPAVIAHNSEEVAKALAEGYGLTYVKQEYPKHVNRPDGTTVTVNNSKEERAALSK